MKTARAELWSGAAALTHGAVIVVAAPGGAKAPPLLVGLEALSHVGTVVVGARFLAALGMTVAELSPGAAARRGHGEGLKPL